MKNLFISIILSFLSLAISAQMINESNYHLPPNYDADERFGIGLSGEGNTFIIGSSGEKLDTNMQNPIVAAGAVNVFEMQPDSSLQFVQKIVPSHREVNAGFGFYTAISGSSLMVSSEDDQLVDSILVNRAGAVYFYENINGTWKEVNRFQPPDKDSVISTYGWDIAIDGNWAVVGATLHPYDENGQNYFYNGGTAYIYKKDVNGNWSYHQKISPTYRHTGTFFGNGVAIWGNLMAVSCPGNAYDTSGNVLPRQAGAVYLYKLGGNGEWADHQMILPHDMNNTHDFGASLEFNDNQLIIGDPSEGTDETGNNFIGGTGSVFVYEESGGKYFFKQKIVSPNREYLGQFGMCLSAEKGLAIIGSYYEKPDPNKCVGNLYFYEKNSQGFWNIKAQLEPQNRSEGGRFGIEGSVLVHNRKLLAANHGQVYNGSYGGGVVFEFQPPKYASIKDDVNISSFSVFPNPTTTSLFVEFESNEATYQLLDISGRIQQEGWIKNGEEIDISGLTSGVYIIRLGSRGKVERFVKLIKQ